MNRIDQLRKFLKEDPEDAFLLFALARELTRAGEPSEALKTYYHLQKLHPGYVGLYYHLGQLEEYQGLREQARATYRAGILQAQEQGDQHARQELEGVLALLREQQ
ncbi:MAG: tetratricopeptide repeat protein [Saprospiraceae bacterium]|nr:tetratricopeptide repeat protein [Saprospiraceae bacterium]